MAEYPQIGVRVDADFIKQIDEWRKKQDDIPSRPEAIRRLVEIGLSKSEPPKGPKVLSTAKQSAARAAELAGDAIDKRSDQNASTDERKVRKRRLVEGPSIVRNTRKDRPGK